jgi:hypothetical protein
MSRRVITATVLVLWCAAGLALGASGALEKLPRPALQGMLFGLTIAILAWAFVAPAGRAWVGATSLRGLMLVHLVRFVGAYFLWLHAQGRLPYDFAVRGGWGDILVASLAAVLLLIGPERRGLRPIVLLWNIAGLLDILMVIFFAARSALGDPASMVELARVPLCLLPTMVVPLIISSHVLIFARLGRMGGAPATGGGPSR